MIEEDHIASINICSMMSELGRETVSAYAAAKGVAEDGLATLWAWWAPVAPYNGIGPGYIPFTWNCSAA